jgi:hypothetical protein
MCFIATRAILDQLYSQASFVSAEIWILTRPAYREKKRQQTSDYQAFEHSELPEKQNWRARRFYRPSSPV